MWTFFAEHIFAILGTLGGLGAIGAIAALVFFGIPFAVVVAKALDFLRALIGFFETPLGAALGILILCGLSAFASDVRRTRIDAVLMKEQRDSLNRQWQAVVDKAADDFEDARKQRDAEVDADIAKTVADKTAEIEALQQKANANEGKAHPNCVLSPDDLNGLRGGQDSPAAAKPGPTRKRWRLPFSNGG